MRFLQKYFKKKPDGSAQPPFVASLRPDHALFVLGDIHGRLDLLARLLDQVNDQRKAGSDLVFVGDLIDRGEESAQVLAMVQKLCQDPKSRCICLMGNHERMMLDFLEHSTERGPRWLRYGGLQTLMSFGLRGIHERADDNTLITARNALREALPKAQETWLRSLPLSYQNGNVWVVHAAADPNIPMEAQSDKTLLWGHKDFFTQTRQDGQWVIHGHTITDQAIAEDGRINVDTGAYATGRLSCVHILGDQAIFLP